MSSIAEIDVVDEVSPLIEYFLETNKRYVSALGKSVGWWYSGKIKKEITKGYAGNVVYPERWSLELRRKLDAKAPKQFYGRIKQAIGYEYDNGVTKIGWTSLTSAHIGELQEKGFNKFVTERMRGHFRSVGINLKNSTHRLEIPARPIYTPMAEELRPEVAPYMEFRVQKYMERGLVKSKQSRRRYKVY